ncbi:class 1 fructose-bisphosphatase [Mangrovicoccus sp. HB161399]|uniref:class 1 fructose-bisphosphatase n=1 Tax=Mangrovicoccus sp. HB161399 TaxID=2720392 RepID=UPI0015577AEF|nr:class 1 fructose-bisphosphatase [Mangrovicoccus sp. HB161399]
MQNGLEAGTERMPDALRPLMTALAGVAAGLAARIAAGPLGDALGAEVGENADGDAQKALDVMADEAFLAAVAGTGVRHYASEERDEVLEVDPAGTLALAIDPLDGSSNIDVNVSIGTIFGISQAAMSPEASVLRDGHALIAAGYFIYGPSTQLVATFGEGVLRFVLDRATGRWIAAGTLEVPTETREFAINASNYRHWSRPVRSFVDDCLSGRDGPCGRNWNMRWIASLVAETHRILTRGGIFLYPGDGRDGYGQGRLRMAYECHPIAMVIEQAGGKATNGTERMLDQMPLNLHARSPLAFGSARAVERLTVYHDLPEEEVSALFGTRGLFRA